MPLPGRPHCSIRRGNAGGTFTGATWQAKGAFVYDAGADYAFTKRISLRVECRDYLYKAPDLNLACSNINPWTHTAQASAGIVFRFYRVRRRGEVEGDLAEHRYPPFSLLDAQSRFQA
jgi:hypothetical protein